MTEPRMSILAIHPGALGDVILFGHLLAALIPSERPGPGNPQSSASSAAGRSIPSVTLVAGGEKARLLATAGVVDAAMDFDSLPMHELFSDVPLQRCRLPSMVGTSMLPPRDAVTMGMGTRQ